MPPLGLIIQIYFLRIVLDLDILIYNINIVTGKVNGTVSVIFKDCSARFTMVP